MEKIKQLKKKKKNKKKKKTKKKIIQNKYLYKYFLLLKKIFCGVFYL